MSVLELNRNQLLQLKQDIVFKRNEEQGTYPSWQELATADNNISDSEVYTEYSDWYFVNEDFYGTINEI